jgi:hypothetical protein
MTVAEWSTIANLATALGTLILAVATFSAVRSFNLMAKVAQQQLLIQLRPVLGPVAAGGPGPQGQLRGYEVGADPGGGAVGASIARTGDSRSTTSVR